MRRALAFLTIVGGAVAPDRRTLSWFPLVGALIGAVVGGVWWAAGEVWPAAVAAALVVAVDLVCTGLLHADGLVDSADGLLPQVPAERRLEIMAEPTVGAYGVVVAATVLLLRFAALASMVPSVLLVVGVWCASRTVMAVAARAIPYARADGGLVSAMTGGPWAPVAVYGTALAVGLGALTGEWRGPAAAVACLIGGAGVIAAGRRRLGGITGDVLGAAGIVGETVGLLVAASRW